jgi:large conductance mechanosensitive channel
MGFIKDFKAFALRGNVMDLAVGVIIGAAFGKIVSALVDDIIMPVVGVITPSGKKFTDQFVVLKEGKSGSEAYSSLAEAKADGANVFAYGDFIQTVVDFMIIAFCIFLIIRLMNRLVKKKEEETAPPAGPSPTEQLLMEIRDELKKR